MNVISIFSFEHLYYLQKSSGEWFKSLCVRHVFLVIAGVTILVTRWRVMGSAPPTFQVFDNPHSFVNNTLLRVSISAPYIPSV